MTINPMSAFATPGWNMVGDLNVARQNHTTTLLSDGRVLVTGGKDDGGSIINQAMK
jgi:hypothetical protein